MPGIAPYVAVGSIGGHLTRAISLEKAIFTGYKSCGYS